VPTGRHVAGQGFEVAVHDLTVRGWSDISRLTCENAAPYR
jgi:hypothetical protein